MRKIIILFAFGILLSSVFSAEILLQQQPKDLYNLGDTIYLPVKITTMKGLQQTFRMSIICNAQQKEFYMNDVNLIAGEEISFNPVLRLTKDRVGGLNGDCSIKAVLGEEYKLTEEFYVSNFVKIDFPNDKVEFNPGENIAIKGTATKESGETLNGILEYSIISDSENISLQDTVNSGDFSINVSLPKKMAAGVYLTKIKIYEKDQNDEITNNGFVDYNIMIKQVPTTLEIVYDSKEIEPGTNVKVKAILHDQTGESIATTSIITIKDQNNNILQQVEKPTNEFLEFPVKYNEAPAQWNVFAVSSQLTGDSKFLIKEKQDVKTELINKTLIVTNTGNVPFNNTLLVKIGEKIMTLNVSLPLDATEKFVLSAPDGQYTVEVISNGQNKISDSVMLTGDSIDVRKATEGVVAIARHPLVWIFLVAILGFITFIVYKKGYQKTFFGYITKKKDRPIEKIKPEKTSMINQRNKAELSLSIKGDKQNSSLICVQLKNLREIDAHKGGEILSEIIRIGEEGKASTYENGNNIFFIYAPATTKTFKNEKTALLVAEKIKNFLTEHNKLARQKVDFGISLTYGTIIAKRENGILKFMSMGTLITGAKKIASLAEKEILLGESIKERLMADIKTEKSIKQGVAVYSVKEIKKQKEDNLKFIGEFVHRMERF